LQNLDDKRAVPVLKQLLSDRSRQIREAAQDALDSLSN
jgi:HEAT repeat protein